MESANKTHEQETVENLNALSLTIDWANVQTSELIDVSSLKNEFSVLAAAEDKTKSIAGTWFINIVLTVVITFFSSLLHLSPRVTFSIIVVAQLLAYTLAALARVGFNQAMKASAANYVLKLQALHRKYPR